MKKSGRLSLKKQLELQEILSNVSSSFVAFDEKNAKANIEDALGRLGQFVHADRVYVFDYDFKANVCNNSYEWCQAGIEPMIDMLQGVPLNDIQDWVNAHLKGETLYFPDVMVLDPQDAVRQILEPQGVLSLIAVPMMMGKRCYGFVGLDSVREKYIYTLFEQKILSDFSKNLLNFILRIEAEDKLIESQMQLKSVLNVQDVLIFRYTPDLKVSYINQKALRYFGRLENTVLGQSLLQYLNIDKQALLPHETSRFEMSSWINDVNYWIQWEIIPIYNSVRELVEFQCIGQDITKSKRMSVELDSFQKRYEYILKASGIGAWEWNVLNGSVTIDHQFANMFGYTIEELYPFTNAKYMEMVHPDDQNHISDYFNTLIEGEIKDIRVEYRLKHKDGHTIWIRDQGKVMVKDQNKKAQLIYGTTQDVTEEHTRQDQIRVVSQAIDQNANAIIVTNADSEILYINQAFTTMMGYTQADVIGKKTSILNSGYHDQSFYDYLWKTIQSGHTWKGRFKNRRKDGELYWEEAAISPVIDEKGVTTHYIANKIDISERLELERQVQEFNSKVNKLFDHVPGMVFQLQMNTEGIISFPLVSKGITEYEITAEEVKYDGNRLYRNIDPRDFEAFIKKLEKSASELSYFEMKFRIRLPKKGLRWVDASMNPEKQEDASVLWHGYLQDITEKVNLEETLSMSERRFNLAIEATEAGVWDWDMIHDVVQFSDQWKAMLGYQTDEIEGSFEAWRKLWHPDDVHSIEAAIDRYLRQESESYEVVHRLKHKSGSYRWIMTRGRIIFDENGLPLRWIGTNIDITERKEIERELEENIQLLKIAQLEAESANKLKTSFLANISHEIRTPMNAILAYAYMLSKEQLTFDQLIKIQNITRSGEHLLQLINDILDMSVIESGKQKLMLSTFKLQGVIEDVQSILEHQALNKKLNLIFKHNVSEHVLVKGDVSKLRQILINLGNNAIKFTDQGNVRIEIEVSPLNTKSLSFKACISDSGTGIDEVDIHRIFEPFVRNERHEKTEGTGLGLAITKNYVDMMHGHIRVENNSEGGAIFYVDLILELDKQSKPIESIPSKQFYIVQDDSESQNALRALREASVNLSEFETVVMSGDVVGMLKWLEPYKEEHEFAIKHCEQWIHDFEYEKLMRWIYDGK
ncbi:MAG TPA: hypothetical protein DIC19_04940 [Erysipelotrichaceae bacterium]|nr:hypothetical protein [Erysipelotrichaceae bacterium]